MTQKKQGERWREKKLCRSLDAQKFQKSVKSQFFFAQCRFTPGICSVAAFIHFFRCCRRWGSSTTSRWKVSLGRVVLARLIEPPIVHARIELVDDSTCAVTFSRASKLACCRGRHADSNVHLEVGGDILSTCEAILKLSCMFR